MRHLLLILLLTTLPSLAATRTWRSADGTKSFSAEFVSTDGNRVTLKRSSDNRILTFTSEKLHSSDREWIKANTKPNHAAGEEVVPEGTAFDTLEFGDTRTTVEEKLKKSPRLTTTVNETLFGRTGLNGIFKTKSTIGGIHCYLYFDWTSNGKLREVTLQTQPAAKHAYNSDLKANWYELSQLLAKLHGNAVQSAPFPKASELQDGLMLGSHLWYTEDSHSVILCTGQERDKYIVAVRFTSEHITPVKITDTGEPIPDAGQRVAPE
ncbi:MAG: hypothetical protein OSA48_11370 [Akkermansiaceae bacterium]|nr:hypothetical protein [Akkermansiaceae bacterium]